MRRSRTGGGRKIHVDASLVEANASLRSVKPLDPELAKAIEQTARERVQKLDEQDDDQDPPLEGGSGGGSTIGQYSKTNRQFRSKTDPDATLVRQGYLLARSFTSVLYSLAHRSHHPSASRSNAAGKGSQNR